MDRLYWVGWANLICLATTRLFEEVFSTTNISVIYTIYAYYLFLFNSNYDYLFTYGSMLIPRLSILSGIVSLIHMCIELLNFYFLNHQLEHLNTDGAAYLFGAGHVILFCFSRAAILDVFTKLGCIPVLPVFFCFLLISVGM